MSARRNQVIRKKKGGRRKGVHDDAYDSNKVSRNNMYWILVQTTKFDNMTPPAMKRVKEGGKKPPSPYHLVEKAQSQSQMIPVPSWKKVTKLPNTGEEKNKYRMRKQADGQGKNG